MVATEAHQCTNHSRELHAVLPFVVGFIVVIVSLIRVNLLSKRRKLLREMRTRRSGRTLKQIL